MRKRPSFGYRGFSESVPVMMAFALAVIAAPFLHGIPGEMQLHEVRSRNAVIASADAVIPAVHAKGACLIDGKSGEVLFSENADRRLPMASTTKIMTALVAIERLSLGESVKIPREAVGVEGSSIYLEEGETVKAETLFYGLMLESGNDAATALAILTAGSTENFAALMNEKAASLGLSDTHFTNPHGLHDEEHYTTPRELAIIAAQALENPLFAEIAATESKVCGGGDEKTRYFTNHNKMLKLYGDAVGVKTGFTRDAGRCLVSAAEREGMLLVAVTLGCPDDWTAHREMLDYGFENHESAYVIGAGDIDVSPFGIANGENGGRWITRKKGSGSERYSLVITGSAE